MLNLWPIGRVWPKGLFWSAKCTFTTKESTNTFSSSHTKVHSSHSLNHINLYPQVDQQVSLKLRL